MMRMIIVLNALLTLPWGMVPTLRPSVRPSGIYNLCPSPLNLRAAWRIVESVGYGPSRPTRQHGTNRVMSLFIGTTLLLFGYMSVLCVR